MSSGEDEEDEHQGEQASPFGGQVLTNDHKSKTRAAKRLLGRRVTKINEGFGLARMGRQGSILQPRKQLPSQQQQQQQQRSLRRSSTLPTIDAGETSVGLKSRSYSSAQLKATDMKSMRGDNKEYSSFTDTLNSPILKNLRENAASHNSHVYVSELNTKALMSRSKSTSALYTPRTRKRHRIPRNSMQAFDTDQWMRKRGKMLKRKIAPNTKMHYWLMFDLLDQNKNGLLDMHELVSALHNIGMMVSRSELRQMISALSRKDSLTFEEFVNGFTAVSEWDKLFEIRKQRLKHQNKDPALPFVLWVPAYHRTQTLKAIMQMKGIKDKTSTGLTGLKEKSRQAGGTTLTEQWKYVQRMIASNNKDQL